MSDLLDSLAGVPGVVACAVFDSDCRCVEDRTEPPFETALLVMALDQIHNVFTVAAVADEDVAGHGVSDCYAEGTDGWLFLRRVDGFEVLAVGTGAVNAPALKVAFNVTEMRVRERFRGRPPVAGPAPVLTTVERHADRVLDDSVVDAILSRLKAHLGPAAKAVLGREMQRLGLTSSTLTQHSYPALIARLCARIPQPDWQRTFEREAVALIAGLPRSER